MKFARKLTRSQIGLGRCSTRRIGMAGALVTLAALAALTVTACSSSATTDTGTSNVGKPPAKPANAPTTSTTEKNFALHTLLLGDIARGATVPTPTTAWKKFGYNIDGKVSTKETTDTCKLLTSVKTTQVDGDNGIDNSFGANILPVILQAAGADAAANINKAIANGTFTIMFDITGLTDDPKQTSTGLSGQLLAGGTFKGKPTFTSADDWPVRDELLSNKTDPKSSTIQFGDSYVSNGTWVNGTQSDVKISLVLSGASLDLTVHKASITFDHTSPNKAENGTIAGVINTTELIAGLKKVAGRISTSLCSGSSFATISDQITQASDIMSDGSAGSQAVECDAISIGLGFTADVIGNPKTVAPPATPSANPCDVAVDAGTTD